MVVGTGVVIFGLNILATIWKVSKWRRKKSSRTERQKEKTRLKSTQKFSSSPFWPRIVLFLCFDFKICHKSVVPWNMKRAWTRRIFFSLPGTYTTTIFTKYYDIICHDTIPYQFSTSPRHLRLWIKLSRTLCTSRTTSTLYTTSIGLAWRLNQDRVSSVAIIFGQEKWQIVRWWLASVVVRHWELKSWSWWYWWKLLVGLIFVNVMAPTDPTFVKDSSSASTNIRVEPTLIQRFRGINRLSLGRNKNRKRTANEETIKVAVPSEGQNNFSSMVNAPSSTSLNNHNSKKFKADANATDENKTIMNGHNHHKISETGRLLGSSNSATGKSSSSNSSCHNTSIAALCNLGNTCFLNSVLYTLRFTPGFLHNLHVSVLISF